MFMLISVLYSSKESMSHVPLLRKDSECETVPTPPPSNTCSPKHEAWKFKHKVVSNVIGK